MKRTLILVIICLMTLPCNGRTKVSPIVKRYYRDSLPSLTERCNKVLKAAYMEGKLLDVRKDLPGWEGYPVELWEYYTGEDVYLKAPKRGLVYMLNPTGEQMAKWIVNAVYDATGEIAFEDVEKIRKHILWQSGAQFPVSGVVYEAMYTKDFYEPYVFKDGVTVYVADSTFLRADKHPDDTMLRYYTTLTDDQIKPNTGRYARICSTTREMYYNAGGTAEVGKSDDGCRSRAWLSEVRRLYQEAWKSDRNFLIYAWAKSNLGK